MLGILLHKRGKMNRLYVLLVFSILLLAGGLLLLVGS